MPDSRAQIPTPDELIGKGIDRLVELRPRALRHINAGSGGYSKILAGWRAQAALLVRRLADHAVNGRLPFSAGAPLLSLADSEFSTVVDLSPATAVGQVTMTRAASRPGGTIRLGARWSRPADPSSQALFPDASYVASRDVPVSQGATTVTVPLVASRPGTFANRPYTGSVQTELQIADEIVDRTAWTVQSYEMGGGSDGVSDQDIQRYASAYSLGQFAPNDRAAIAGAYLAGAKRVVAVDDPTTAMLRLYIADASWAGSTEWAKRVHQFLDDNRFIGFGCRIGVSYVTNTLVTVEATCKVRDPSFLTDTSGIEVAIQKTLRAYFDNRSDWNMWSLRALRSVIARADRRLLSCPSVAVKGLDGSTIPEPTTSAGMHYYLLDNGVATTFVNPS